MNSNSPVLLLPPSAVPTAPVLAPMLLSKPRGLISPTEKPVEVVSSVVGKPNLKLLEHALVESGEGKALREASPVTPSPLAPPATSAPAAAAASGTAFSPREPSSKLAAQVALAAGVKLTSANAAPIVGATASISTSSSSSAAVTPVTVPKPSAPAQPSTPVTTAVRAPAGVAAAAGKRAAAVSPPASPTASISASVPSSPDSPKATKSNTGRWTEAEHQLFLQGLEQFPYRAWKKIATLIKTRTVVQIRTHAQKYYQKLEKEEQRMREREAQLASQQGNPPPATTAATPVLTTPRAAPISAPSTPSSASLQELTQRVNAFATPVAVPSPVDDAASSGKRKGPLRKRKASAEDLQQPQSSLPKRMMKEKKFVREKTMSPKQKTVVSTGRMFSFADALSAGGDSKSAGGPRGLSGLKTNPLDFDDDDDVASSTTSSMMLDFADEKHMIEYPFALDSALERGLAAIDHDELLQLSDDESMEWFSSSSTSDDQDDDLMDGSRNGSSTPVGSPLNLGRYPFSPLYSEDCLQFVDPSMSATQCSTPSPVLSGAADCSDFGLSGDEAGDEDDDFVLDPEKFLSSYFSPDASDESS